MVREHARGCIPGLSHCSNQVGILTARSNKAGPSQYSPCPANYGYVAQWLEHLAHNKLVERSSRSISTKAGSIPAQWQRFGETRGRFDSYDALGAKGLAAGKDRQIFKKGGENNAP